MRAAGSMLDPYAPRRRHRCCCPRARRQHPTGMLLRLMTVCTEEHVMDEAEARTLLRVARESAEDELVAALELGQDDRAAVTAEREWADQQAPKNDEEVEDAVAVLLRDRLDRIARAEQRLVDGTFGVSVRSGLRIPDDRADPAAELTVDEARESER